MIETPTSALELRVTRTMDAAYVNALANHPDVRPTIGPPSDAPIDLTALVGNPDNLVFRSASGGAIVGVAMGSGRYNVHTLFCLEQRGKPAYEAMRDAADFMFTATDCTDLRTTVPESHRGASVAARRIGFQPLFTSRLPWGETWVEATCLQLTLDRWALADDTARLEPLGAWFHAQIADAKQIAGSAAPIHPDDPIHDRAVGATCLMVQAGQIDKGVRFYNVWAACAGYAAISILRYRPTILDVQDAVIEVGADHLEVLRCR